MTGGPTSCRNKNDNSDDENEMLMDVTNNTAAIERLGHIITNATADIDNANHNNPTIMFTTNDPKNLKSSFEEFSRNFDRHRKTSKNNRNASKLANEMDLSSDVENHQLDNKPRITETDNLLKSISEGTLRILSIINEIFLNTKIALPGIKCLNSCFIYRKKSKSGQ